MAKKLDPQAILDALKPSLTGLKPGHPGKVAFKAGAPTAGPTAGPAATSSPLGVLAGFSSAQAVNGITVWTGKGFNIVELPNRNMATPPNTPKFQVKLNAYTEQLTFTRFANDAPAPNRGNSQGDVDIFAIQYFQSIDDAVTGGGIHAETGMWLTVTDPTITPSPMLARLGVVPHGDTIQCQGFQIAGHLINTPPQFAVADTTPFTLDAAGNRVNDTSTDYLKAISSVPLPPGITAAMVQNPNLLLQQHLAGTTVVGMDVLMISAQPIAGIDGVQGAFKTIGDQGTMGNIPFVVKNANANSMTCIFWIETVTANVGGKAVTFQQLQYSQTIILDFQVLGANGKPVAIKWPHVSVATLREPGAPPLP